MSFIVRVLLIAVVSLPVLAEDAAIRLNTIMSGLNAIRGDFQQVITDDEGEVVEENSGTFVLQRPGLFRWHISPPFEKLIVSDQKQIWTYDPDLEQVVVEPVSEQLLQSPMTLLSGDLEKIKSNFSVSRVDSRQLAGDEVFQLIPRGRDTAFERMLMGFENGKLTGMVLYSALGETQVYAFSRLAFNGPVDAATFTFEPPADVDVLINKAP